MAILVKTDLRAYLDVVKSNISKKAITNIGSKKEDVVFSIATDDTNVLEAIKVANQTSSIVEVDYVGVVGSLASILSDVTVPYNINYMVETGADIYEQDIVSHLQSVPEGVTLVFKVPESFCDMEFIYNMCHKYENIRFTGGTFFLMGGCNLGSYDHKVLERKGIKFKLGSHIMKATNGVLQEVGIDDVDLEFTDTRNSGNGKKKTVKAKKVSSLITMGGSIGL